MVSQETKDKILTGFGAVLTVTGLFLFVLTFFSARDILELQFGPGELYTSLIGLGAMFAVSAFLVVKGGAMLSSGRGGKEDKIR